MRGRWIGFVILGSVVGCQSSSPAYDPFAGYGATRVPAPATGSIGRNGYAPAAMVPVNPPVNPPGYPSGYPNGYPSGYPAAAPPALREVPSLAPAPNAGSSYEPPRDVAPLAANAAAPDSDGLVWLTPAGTANRGLVPTGNVYSQATYNQSATSPPPSTTPYYAQPTYSQPTYSQPTYSQPRVVNPLEPLVRPGSQPAAASGFRPLSATGAPLHGGYVRPAAATVPVTEITRSSGGSPWREDDCACGPAIDIVSNAGALQPIPYESAHGVVIAAPGYGTASTRVSQAGWHARDPQ